jgi:hypothetical protein
MLGSSHGHQCRETVGEPVGRYTYTKGKPYRPDGTTHTAELCGLHWTDSWIPYAKPSGCKLRTG